MDSKVITYTDPRQIENLSSFHEYRDVLHICATKNLRDALVSEHQNRKNTITAPIVMANQLLDSVFVGWDEPITKLEQYLRLSEIIRNFQGIEAEYRQAFRRNQSDILDTIRLLEISQVTPSIIRKYDLTLKEELFIEIWEQLENTSTVQRIRKLLSSGLKGWPEIVNRTVEMAYAGSKTRNYQTDYRYDAIVLHGFYFITPEQQQVFSLLQNAGIQIIFLQLYDDRFPKSFDFISDFINPSYGWPDYESWIKETWDIRTVSLADKFLYDFEGIQLEYEVSNINLKKHRDFYEFLDEFEKDANNTNKTFLAPNAASLNDRLQDYYPEKFRHKRHFLSFPIGQFLFQLHQMWDEEENTLAIKGDALFECFASRWIYDHENQKNAHEYTSVLDDILIFFKDCHSKESWELRAEQLVYILDEVIEPFKKVNGDRFSDKMGSPFTAFSQFAHKKEDVLQVIRFIQLIFNIAYELFGDGRKKISLAKHFEVLRRVVGMMNPYLKDNITKQEKLLLEKVRSLLNHAPSIPPLHVEDISSAISLFLAGKLSKDRDTEIEGIRPFIEIDGEVFKEKAVTHITGLDENSLPYQEFELPWPLTSTLFDSLCRPAGPLRFMKLRNENVKQITRYLLYNAFQFSSKLELSWMVEYDGNDKLDKAIYLSQLQLEPDKEDLSPIADWHEEILDNEVKRNELDYLTAFPMDALAEFQFCGRRFYYSHVVSRDSYFDNDFMQEFLFGNLTKVMGALLPEVKDQVISDEVYKLFPQWDTLKKETLAKDNLKFRVSTKDKYSGYVKYGENHEFSDMRKLFLFPGLSEKKKETKGVFDLYEKPGQTLAKAREELERQLTREPIQLEATPGNKCRYCPHNSICSEAYHPVDDKSRKSGGRK